MKTIKKIMLVVLMLVFTGSYADSPAKNNPLTGAWKLQKNQTEEVLLFQDGYFTHTTYNLSDKKFLYSRGGTFQQSGNALQVMMEFNSQDKEEVGKTLSYTIAVDNLTLTANLNGVSETWKRIDDGTAPLAGVWQITDRMQDGKIVPIHRTGSRKTLKILTGTRFQWAAINPETKEFSGTGGGTYTFSDGKYTEHIEFFSRDNSRVGADLTFDGKLENSKWHHSGLSSKGAKIYEIWSRTKE